MATITRENIGLLNDKLKVKITKDDYLPAFDKSIKQYAKTANIPGFRKGMVPSSMIKKMYGQSVMSEEIFKSVEKELNSYLTKEQLEIFAQPLPLPNDSRIDVNSPVDYDFDFEIGLKPAINIELNKFNGTRYVIEADDKLIDEEVDRMRTKFGKMTEPESVTGEDNVLNVNFVETDLEGNVKEGGIKKDNSVLVKYFTPAYQQKLQGAKTGDTLQINIDEAFGDKEKQAIEHDLNLAHDAAEKNFKLEITKVGLVEKAEMNEEFYKNAYPNNEINNEADFRNALKGDIENYYKQQSRNQLHDQLYHFLLDNTTMELPEGFLKRWLQNGGEKVKTEQEAENEYPTFANQLKWTLITNELVKQNNIDVTPDDIKAFAKAQLFGYMGMNTFGDDQPWMEDYLNKMMKDQKYVEDSYHRITTEKLFDALDTQISAKEENISADAFAEKLHHHHH